MRYSELLAEIYGRPHLRRVELGLERISRLLASLGNPHRHFDVVHVAGTNGKGSVCTKIAAGLQEAGKRVGLFTSPHLATFRERIRINGAMIDEIEVVELLAPMLQTDATFFELSTALAFRYFAQQQVDIAVIETGLGGRLDATNVVDPRLTIITSIGIDHSEILGNDLAAITREKAGIAKPGVPLIIGPNVPFLAADVIVEPRENFLAENRAIAAAALDQLGVPLAGLDAMPLCRFEQHGNVWLDVAHNPAGIRALRQLIPATAHVLLGTSMGKDREGMVAELEGLSVDLVDVDHPRIAPAPHRLRDRFALCADEPLVICGSCYLMKEARSLVGAPLPCDPVDLQELPAR